MRIFMGVSKFVRYSLATMIGVVVIPLTVVAEWMVVCLVDEEDQPNRRIK